MLWLETCRIAEQSLNVVSVFSVYNFGLYASCIFSLGRAFNFDFNDISQFYFTSVWAQKVCLQRWEDVCDCDHVTVTNRRPSAEGASFGVSH